MNKQKPYVLEFFMDKEGDASDIPSQKIYDPWKVKKLTQEEFDSLRKPNEIISFNQLLYLSWFGLLAPTTHNTIPQRFALKPQQHALEIWIDRKYILPYSDRDGRQGNVSIGCVIANVELAASCFGFETNITITPSLSEEFVKPYMPQHPQYTHVATLHFTKGKKSAIDWLTLILARKVVRAEYDETVKLPALVTEELQKLVKEKFPHLSLHLINDKLRMYGLAKFQEMADRTVFEWDVFAYELGEWLLENTDIKSPIGMRGKEFGFDDTFAQKVHNGLLRKERLLPDEIAAFAMGGKIGIKSSSAVAVITAQKDSIEQRIEAGRAYEHLALILQLHGFVTAVHAGITEVDKITKMFGIFLRTTERPTVVFRIGKPLKEKDLSRPHSARPNIREVLLP